MEQNDQPDALRQPRWLFLKAASVRARERRAHLAEVQDYIFSEIRVRLVRNLESEMPCPSAWQKTCFPPGDHLELFTFFSYRVYRELPCGVSSCNNSRI